MKFYKAGVILQIIYCVPCLLVPALMLCYFGFYTSEFGKICLEFSAMITVFSLMNPVGLIGTIMRWIACFTTDVKNEKKRLAWTLVSPLLIVVSWVIAVCFFVGISGGV